MPVLKSAEAKVTLSMPTNLVGIMGSSLKPEVEQPSSERSKVTVDSGESIMEILIEASDVSALRAALNSYLRWVDAILDVISKMDKPAERLNSGLH